jgi:hypothetical protein
MAFEAGQKYMPMYVSPSHLGSHDRFRTEYPAHRVALLTTRKLHLRQQQSSPAHLVLDTSQSIQTRSLVGFYSER